MSETERERERERARYAFEADTEEDIQNTGFPCKLRGPTRAEDMDPSIAMNRARLDAIE